MIGVGTSLLFDRRAGKAGPPIPPFNKAMVDAWFMSGFSNNDKPSSIRGVKGNEMALKNFAYALNSGFGKYEVDFTNLFTLHPSNKDCIIYTPEKIEIIENLNTIFINLNMKKEIPSYKVQVFGVTNPYSLKYQYFDKDGNHLLFNLPNDGIYTIPKSYLTDDDRLVGFIVNDCKNSKGIIITQLPSAYEGALVFDGVDDYGICTGLPIMTDYTVICKRIIETKSTNVVASKSTVFGKGAFIFEIYDNNKNSTWSFGVQNDVDINYNDSVSWQTKKSYNGKNVVVGNANDTDKLLLGLLRENDIRRLKGAIYYFALYNKSLTPEEIETEKERLNEEWLKRSKVTIPEPDVYYDLSLKDNSSPTRNIIDDLSGNGHDAEIFNAAYTESNGYRSDGAFVFDGVDDYAIMKNVKKGFKTVFMEVIPLKIGGMMYDQRINTRVFNFGIYNEGVTFAYYSRNNGVTYINGKINSANIVTDELINKRSIVTVTNALESNCKTIAIASTNFHAFYCNMALYKLIGFYDELTPLQIEKVINDYKLKHD